MQQNQSLLPVFSALNQLGGVSDVELSDSQMDFVKNGCNWTVYQIRNPHPHLFVLHKDGHRILSFSNPESLTNFFKGIEPEEESQAKQYRDGFYYFGCIGKLVRLRKCEIPIHPYIFYKTVEQYEKERHEEAQTAQTKKA